MFGSDEEQDTKGEERVTTGDDETTKTMDAMNEKAFSSKADDNTETDDDEMTEEKTKQTTICAD